MFSRIHVDDIVIILLASIKKPNPLSIYNVADDEPAASHVVDAYAASPIAYKQVLEEDKLCICGILASDVGTLPEKVNKVIRYFFADNARWLTEILVSNNPAGSNLKFAFCKSFSIKL